MSAGAHQQGPWMESINSNFHAAGRGWFIPGVGFLEAWGPTVPSDGETGYGTGCQFKHTDGATANTLMFVNVGDSDSCNFDAIIDTSLVATLASTANGDGASTIGVEDASGYFAATTVEGVLDELAANQLSAQNLIQVPLTDLREAASNNVGLFNTKVIDIPLVDLRETDGTNLLGITDTPLSNTTLGGALGKNTTPILDLTNGDTDSALRVTWIANDVVAVIFKVNLPDINTGADLTITLRGQMDGASDTPVVDADIYFNEGDTKVSDASSAFGASIVDETITVANADIPAAAEYMTVELTPAAHANDVLELYGVRVSYTEATAAQSGGLLTQSTNPALSYANGDTDSGLIVTWGIANQDPLVFQRILPPNLNVAANLVLHFRGKSGGGTDTPVIDLDVYFNEGDTKVSDATAAVTAAYSEKVGTIGLADVPAGAQTVTVEMTPAAHGTDTLIMSGLWLEYTSTILTS